jgi:hypothetical protein
MQTAGVIEAKPGSTQAAGSQAASSEEPEPDRRRAPRYETLIGAFIALERGHRDMRCYILNVSDTGALLRPHDVMRCPSQFMLKPEVGEHRKCEVVWTNGEMLAVRFVGEKAPPLAAREWAALGSEPTTDPVDALAG